MSDWETAPDQSAGWETYTPSGDKPTWLGIPQDVFGKVSPENKVIFSESMKRGFGSGIPKFFYDLGGKVTDATGSPALGYAANVVPQIAMSLYTMTKNLPAPTEEQLSSLARSGERQRILEGGRKLGLTVPPAQANPSSVNRVLESVGGKAATGQQAAASNQDAVYQVAQREAGLLPNEPITLESLKAARDRLAEPYRQIASLELTGPLSQPPFKSPAQTLQDLQDARNEAKQLWNYYKKSGIPKVQRQAMEASSKADALEHILEVQAADAGRPDLVEQLRAARVAIAKNHTVQRAMNGTAFDPASLSRLQSRANVPLGGDLETIMQMQKEFPRAMSAPQVGGSVGVNQLMPWLGGSAGGALGAALGGAPGAGAGAMAGVILGQTVPPAARSVVLSPLYQSLLANVPQDVNPSLLRLLANPSVAAPVGQVGALYRPGQ